MTIEEVKRTESGLPIRAIELDDMTPGVEYYFVYIDLPGKLHKHSVYETIEERDHIAEEYALEANRIMGYAPKQGTDGVNRGNCCSSFVGKWRIMKEVKHEQAQKNTTEFPEGVRPLKT